MRSNDTIQIKYSFLFENGSRKDFAICLNSGTLHMINEESSPPDWALLRHHRCPSCYLVAEKDRYCPIAVSMARVVADFADCASFENVTVTVTTEERIYSKVTSLQQGVSSLTGLVMATSGCPFMEYLKPMARFHLPFASIEETEFRMLSMYLVAQLKRHGRGLASDWTLEGLKTIYARVTEINANFAKRIRDVVKNDANVNAVINLDCFAKAMPWAVRTRLNELDSLFTAYLL